MNLNVNRRHSRERIHARASVVLVVLVLLGIMAVLVVGNSHELHWLQQNLKLVEQKQLKKFPAPPPPAQPTNAPTRRRI